MDKKISKCKQRGLVNKCKKCDCWVPIDDDDLPDCGILVPNEAKQACSKCLEELMTEYSSEYDECVEKVISKHPEVEKEIIKRFMHVLKNLKSEEEKPKGAASLYEF
jgi:hypothetical protein